LTRRDTDTIVTPGPSRPPPLQPTGFQGRASEDIRYRLARTCRL